VSANDRALIIPPAAEGDPESFGECVTDSRASGPRRSSGPPVASHRRGARS